MIRLRLLPTPIVARAAVQRRLRIYASERFFGAGVQPLVVPIAARLSERIHLIAIISAARIPRPMEFLAGTTSG